jgi:hypothetical protein
MTRKAKTLHPEIRVSLFAFVNREGGAMRRANMKIGGQDGFVLPLAIILGILHTSPAMAQQPGTLKEDPSTLALVAKPTERTLASPHDKRTKNDQWYPQNINRIIPPTAPEAACPLAEVLAQAGGRIQELVANLDKFTATEVVEHQSVARSGQLRRPEIRKFSYLVSIGRTPNGYMKVEEYRKGGSTSDQFPDQIATVGTPSLVLIFHPQNAKNFRMTCEDLGQWYDQPAWQIRFEERTDRRNPISVLVMGGRSYGLRLRGRAWILADSYQVARLESDLADEIPEIRLRLQHQEIEYRPVIFEKGQVEIWLPSTSDFYVDLHGHRFCRRHRFTDFQLFSVTYQLTFGPPKL